MRTTPAAAPVATPAIVPLLCCFSGVIVGGETPADVVEAEFELVDVDVVLGDVVGVVKGRVSSVVGGWVSGRSVIREVGCEVGRNVSDNECSNVGCDVRRDDGCWSVGRAVYTEVGRSLCRELGDVGSDLEVEMMAGPVKGDCVGRVVGFDAPATLVANSSWETTLTPASIDEATSLGRAASNTERAFCDASVGREPDMVKAGSLDTSDVDPDNV
jgi:hypothetical protein